MVDLRTTYTQKPCYSNGLLKRCKRKNKLILQKKQEKILTNIHLQPRYEV